MFPGFNISMVWMKFLDDDKEAFATLYNCHVNSLFHYGIKISGDDDMVRDAIQEVFLDLYLKRKNNRTDPENLRYYLLLALKRNLFGKLEKERKLIHDEVESATSFEPEYSIESRIIKNEEDSELNRRIAGFLRKLPGRQKEAIYLRFYECLEYPQIAELLKINVESVRKQVYRGIKTIREIIGSESLILFFCIFCKK